MKRFLAIFSLSCLFVASALGNQTPKEAVAPTIALLDYLNFEAMRTQSEVGPLILAHLDRSLRTDPETAELAAKAARIYGNGFLNTIREFMSAKVISHDGQSDLGFACVVSNPKFQLPPFPQAERVHIDEKTFLKLPHELVHLFPKHFQEKELSVFARNSENALILIAFRDSEKAVLSEKFSGLRADTEKYKKTPGILIYRVFPRHEARQLRPNAFCPTIPAGEFQLTERDGNVNLSATFQCLDQNEAMRLTLFFRKVKTALRNAANQAETETQKNALIAVSDSFTVSADKNLLNVRISCSTKDFPEFFKWRNRYAGKSNKNP